MGLVGCHFDRLVRYLSLSGRHRGTVALSIPGFFELAGGTRTVCDMLIIRWVVLPRIGNAQAALALFMFGLAIAEATCFLGLFIFPAHKQELFALSVLGIVQFVPHFARRFYAWDDKRPNA